MVASSSPSGRYAVSVWVYIMFWATTRPLGDATTDFGEMSPVIRSRRTRDVVSEAGRAGAVVGEPVGEAVRGAMLVSVGTRVGPGAPTEGWGGAAVGSAAPPPTTPRWTPPATRVAAAAPRAIRRRRTDVRS